MKADVEKISREKLLEFLGPGARSYIADHFAKYCSQTCLARFMMRYELMKRVLPIPGSIVECGVQSGVGLFEWLQISKLLEPLNRRRIIYGFDSFAGFPSVHKNDGNHPKAGDFAEFTASVEEINNCLILQGRNNVIVRHRDDDVTNERYVMKHDWEPIQLCKGDFMQTAGPFLNEHPYLLISLLYLDFDLYEPTKWAIEQFLPRMPKGAILAFDELDHPKWPGETLALLDAIDIREHRIERFPFIDTMGFITLGG